MANPAVGYVGAVLGVIAIASIAVFNLHGMAAKAHRHWDADIDRIIAQQQAKKLDTATLARAEIPDDGDTRPQIAALTRDAIEEDEDELAFSSEEAKSKKAQNPSSKKYSRRAERRRQHYMPAAFLTLPKFAATAAATTTTTLLRLR
ncbi:MAG TPA: hypothetical protein VFK79_00125 [Xanthobacteraceae bacterium]|nr:hypothetical protein [Xanthobacteraceae bacterium]